MDSERAAALVGRAQLGDRQATAELISGHLPLVYNIVGRALAGHPDTDDVVQETMLRAVDGLAALRDPYGFRSWLVAIAMNQVRRRHRDLPPPAPGDGLNSAYGLADPGADFVGLTIVRLGLSEQRREVAEATRWLDESDRDLLALWWLEAAGELGRTELAAAMELSPQHAAVRVQRMKGQLEAARVVVRALAVSPRCPWLAELTAGWDGVPSALWRKRIGRHARECAACSQHRDGLVPAEGLLAGLAMVPLPDPFGPDSLWLTGLGSPSPSTSTSASATPSPSPGSPHAGPAAGPRAPRSHRRSSGGGRRRARPRGRRRVAAAGAAVVTVVVAGIVATGLLEGALGGGPATSQVQAEVAAAAGSSTEPSAPGAPSDLSGSPTPSAEAVPSASPASASAAPVATPSPSSPAPSTATPRSTAATAQQVLDLVNTERSRAGCGPVRANSQLQTAAQRHSDDMAARSFFSHTNPDGAGPQQRIDATGYRWSRWGENIARGQRDAAAVMTSWMNSPGHRANILNCSFTELGVGIHTGSGGPWWTQDFGTPM